jgi:hypothetical protein
MNYNYNYYDDYTMIIHHNKIQYKKNQHIKYNFRENITLESLDEGIMINFPYNNVYYSYKSAAKSIPLVRYFKRSGVIPYTFIDECEETEEGVVMKKVKYFCMAIDSKYGNLTDFGGGVKKFETFARAASRELYEESLGIFKFSPESIYQCSSAVYDNNMIVLFVNVKIGEESNIDNIDNTISNYYKRFSSVVESETKGIFWIHESKFYDLIKSGKSIKTDTGIYPSVYKPVSDLLRSVSNINEIV